MWSYYGAKTNIVQHYPKPIHDRIIEPFAGTARYALRYYQKEVIILDKYEVIVDLWKWLQQCSPGDVLRLPRKLSPGQTLDDFNFDCEEARNLMGFLIAKGVEKPRVKPTNRVIVDRPNHINFSLNRIAENLFKIRHWDIRHGSYSSLQNQKATWFIDPPYQFGGQSYVKSSRKIDFNKLGEWCKERHGQIIVCETSKANWMDFKPLVSQKGQVRDQEEVIWTNEQLSYSGKQTSLWQTDTIVPMVEGLQSQPLE